MKGDVSCVALRGGKLQVGRSDKQSATKCKGRCAMDVMVLNIDDHQLDRQRELAQADVSWVVMVNRRRQDVTTRIPDAAKKKQDDETYEP